MPAWRRPRAELCRDRPAQPDEVDTAADVEVARRAAERWGVLSLAELRACGLAREAVGVRVRNGRLHPLHRGVYAVGHANVPLEGGFLAAVKACGPRAVLSHASAAALWGLARLGRETARRDGARVGHAPADGRARPSRAPGARGSSAMLGHPGDVSRTDPGGSRVVAAGANAAPRRAAGAIVAAGERPPCARRTRACRAVPWPRRARRPPDRRPGADAQRAGGCRPRSHPARRARPSAGQRSAHPLRAARDPGLPLAGAAAVVEADGAAWHEHRLAREDDAERQALLEGHGERVLRVTWEQAVGCPGETLRRLRAAGAPPGRRAITGRAAAVGARPSP